LADPSFPRRPKTLESAKGGGKGGFEGVGFAFEDSDAVGGGAFKTSEVAPRVLAKGL